MSAQHEIERIEQDWKSPRWSGITRQYLAKDVYELRGSLRVEHTLARRGAEKLWQLLNDADHIAALGALTGNQAGKTSAVAEGSTVK